MILYHHSLNFFLYRVFMIGLDYTYATKLYILKKSIFVWTSLNREYKLYSFVSSIYLTLYSTSYLALVTPKKQNIHFPPRFLWVTKCSLSSGSHFNKIMEMQSAKESKPGFLSILSGEWIDVPETDRVSRSKFETAFMLLFFN